MNLLGSMLAFPVVVGQRAALLQELEAPFFYTALGLGAFPTPH